MSEGPIIQARDLCKVYQVGKVGVNALRGVDLEVQPGEYLSIVGPSGSGKLTLFHIIGGLTPPTSGSITVAGRDLSHMTDSDRTRMRRRTVGFVFQKFNLLPNLTARDNIAVARFIAGFGANERHAHDDLYDEILELLGIANRLDHKPAELSGGEQQRVAIARAVVKHPAILLADEPTGNLDSENSNAVLEILRTLNKRLGQTVLMITHNPEAAAYADRIVRMKDGRVVGQ